MVIIMIIIMIIIMMISAYWAPINTFHNTLAFSHHAYGGTLLSDISSGHNSVTTGSRERVRKRSEFIHKTLKTHADREAPDGSHGDGDNNNSHTAREDGGGGGLLTGHRW